MYLLQVLWLFSIVQRHACVWIGDVNLNVSVNGCLSVSVLNWSRNTLLTTPKQPGHALSQPAVTYANFTTIYRFKYTRSELTKLSKINCCLACSHWKEEMWSHWIKSDHYHYLLCDTSLTKCPSKLSDLFKDMSEQLQSVLYWELKREEERCHRYRH